MKISRLTYLVILFGAFFVHALSAKENNNEKLIFSQEKAAKEAELCVRELNLKGDSAKIFTQTWIDYQKETHSALQRHRHPAAAPAKKLSQKELRVETDKNIRNRFALAKEILLIREKFYPKFLKVISPVEYEKLSRFERRLGEKMQQEQRRREEWKNHRNKKTSPLPPVPQNEKK